jgi:hypothetical protein
MSKIQVVNAMLADGTDIFKEGDNETQQYLEHLRNLDRRFTDTEATYWVLDEDGYIVKRHVRVLPKYCLFYLQG